MPAPQGSLAWLGMGSQLQGPGQGMLLAAESCKKEVRGFLGASPGRKLQGSLASCPWRQLVQHQAHTTVGFTSQQQPLVGAGGAQPAPHQMLLPSCPGLPTSAFYSSPYDPLRCSPWGAELSCPFPPPSPASGPKRSSSSPSPLHCFPGIAAGGVEIVYKGLK